MDHRCFCSPKPFHTTGTFLDAATPHKGGGGFPTSPLCDAQSLKEAKMVLFVTFRMYAPKGDSLLGLNLE